MSISLEFKPELHFPGSAVEGRVHIDLNEARSDELERVRIKLRGFVHIALSEASGYTTTQASAERVYIQEHLELWRPGSSYPPEGHVLTLPFSFRLPYKLPPSNCSVSKLGKAYCRYEIELTADRHGLLKQSRVIKQDFPVLPDDTPGWLLRQQLQNSSWTGQWVAHTASIQLRRMIWHEHANAQVKLELPAATAFPMSTSVPFKLQVQSHTRPFKRKDTPDSREDEDIFPRPPDMSNITFVLKTRHIVCTGSSAIEIHWSKTEDMCGMDDEFIEHRSGLNTLQVGSKWCVEQNYSVSGTINFKTTSPTYTSRFHTVNHEVVLKVPFSGLNNDLGLSFPVQVTSGHSVEEDAGQRAALELLPDYREVVENSQSNGIKVDKGKT